MTNSYTLSILWVPGCGWVWKKDMFFCVGKSILKFLKLLTRSLQSCFTIRSGRFRPIETSKTEPARPLLRPTPPVTRCAKASPQDSATKLKSELQRWRLLWTVRISQRPFTVGHHGEGVGFRVFRRTRAGTSTSVVWCKRQVEGIDV